MDPHDLSPHSEEFNMLAEEELSEALTLMQRSKRRAAMRRAKGKIKAGRKRAAKRKASKETLKRRSLAAARNHFFKKILKKSKADASYNERIRAEKILAKKKGAIQRLAKKLFPKIKEKEQKKFQKKDD